MSKPQTRHPSQTVRKDASLVVQTRHISAIARLLLFVRAGGRCEFDGCNEYLFEHPLTLTDGNFAEVAHVVAFKPDGARGKVGPRPRNINEISNLMLLCPKCHKLIDDHPSDYSRQTLEKYKSQHEGRIRHVTELGPNRKTAVLVVKTVIGRQTVAIPFHQIVEATSPRYPASQQGATVDLTQIPEENSAFLKVARSTIEQRIARLFDPDGEVDQSGHVSLFALAPIPLLVFLGSQLSNKVPLDVYQRHRDTEDWTWKKSGKPVDYEFRRLRVGTNSDRVALVLSLSGPIGIGSLPGEIDEKFSVYELTLKDITPNTMFLRTRRDLENFRTAYQVALATVMQEHGTLKSLYFFPAVPAPIAVLCGRELLPKVHPLLRVYDFDKKKGFQFTLEVN